MQEVGPRNSAGALARVFGGPVPAIDLADEREAASALVFLWEEDAAEPLAAEARGRKPVRAPGLSDGDDASDGSTSDGADDFGDTSQ